MSKPEVYLWERFRGREPGKPKFRRQHPFGPYILDFFCAPARLAIEIDGEGHYLGAEPQYDARRDAWVRDQGVRVVRIPARWVMERPDEMAERALKLASAMIARREGLVRAFAPPPLRGPPPPYDGEVFWKPLLLSYWQARHSS